MAYNPTVWETRKPITAALLNHLESGVASAFQDITTNANNIENISRRIGDTNAFLNKSIRQTISEIEDDINQIKASLSGFSTGTLAARLEVVEEDIEQAKGENYNHLADRIEAMVVSINDNHTLATNINTSLNDVAKTIYGVQILQNGQTFVDAITQLKNRVDDAHTIAVGASSKANSNEASINAASTIMIEANDGGESPALATALFRLKRNINNVDNKLGYTDAETINAQSPTNIRTIINNKLGYTDDETIKATPPTNVRTIINGDILTAKEAAIASANSYTDTQATELNNAINDLEGEINAAHRTSNDTLDGRFDSIDSSISLLNTSVGAVQQSLQNISQIATYTRVVESLPQTPVAGWENDDYLLGPDDGTYKYYRWLNNTWVLISGGSTSGGGGTGNTAGYVFSTYADYVAFIPKAVNTDYYVLEDDNLYHHYRYIDRGDENHTLDQIEIGVTTNAIKRYNLHKLETIDKNNNPVNYLDLYEFNYGEDNTIDEEHLEDIENRLIAHIQLPVGGGGSSYSQKLTRISDRNIVKPYGTDIPVLLQFFYTSGIARESGIGKVYLDDILIMDEISIISGDPTDASSSWPTGNSIPDGFYSIDVSSYCTELSEQPKQFRLVVTDTDDQNLWKELRWTVDIMNLTITSTFTEHYIADKDSNVTFTYVPIGAIDKTVHFTLNDITLPSVNLSKNINGAIQEYIIPAPTETGAYKLKAWLTASVNGRELPASQAVIRDIIWRNTASNDLIISSKYRDAVNEPITQYDIISIPYTLVGGITPYTVTYYVDDMVNPIDTVTLNGNEGVWEYATITTGVHTFKISCQNQSITFTVNVTESIVDISPVTRGLAIDFNPQGITNSSNKRIWSNSYYHMRVTNNFDWNNGGYRSDDSGDYFLIKAGTRAIFDYRMFTGHNDNGQMINDVFQTGKELKITFKTTAVRNADAVWFTNMGASSTNSNAKLVGIQLNVHNGFLKTDAASDEAVGGIEATNTYLYFPYSEEDKIELDININPSSDVNNNFIMSFEDGCPSKAYPYSASEVLYQPSVHNAQNNIDIDPSEITIGSDDCDVYIYRMRIYERALSTEEILRNFIADGKNIQESIQRYDRNCIYYDTVNKVFVPYTNESTILDPERLAIKIPDVKVLMLETPQFTANKKDFIPYSSLRCIHAPGGKYYKSRGKEDNWLFQNGYHAGQGTTSDKYGNAGRNLDFLFMCDGVHSPSDKVVIGENFLPGYQSSLILGYGTDEQQEPMYCLDWKDNDTWKPNTTYELNDLVRYDNKVYKCTVLHVSENAFDSNNWELQEGYTNKVTLTSSSIPNNFFNLKVNIASSENANNALLQKRYNDYLPYLSPAKLRDARIKNDMEFVPAVIFIKETGQAEINGQTITYTRRAFNDNEWHFYALGNIGDSKKTDYTRAYDPDDMNEFTLEISDNNTNNSQFQSGVYYSNIYFDRVTNPIIEDISKYYEASGTPTLVENTNNRYTGTFTLTTDTTINGGKIYYVQARMIELYHTEQDRKDDGSLKDTFTAYTDAGEAIQTINYVFPIELNEWNSNNMRYWSLFNEKFDGDHSFEMRYACQGNYRDGKLVNDTHGKITINNEQISRDKYQVNTLNTNVWRAFYTWLITSTPEQFEAELEEWCVKSSVIFFYAFTHYYTMMDNRAKNTFWHFAKTGIHRRVSRPVEALYHIYEIEDGEVTKEDGIATGNFKQPEGNFDPNGIYYTQYAFDMWVYDTDTALGIDNNGELVFPYGKEDTDYRISDNASTSYVFNGAGSVFWRRLRDTFNDDIRSTFTNISECFNANSLIEAFDNFQECYPEAIWRLDVERKYIRSFTGDTENGTAITTKETRFLRDMMQGRKKYQRRQWCKDQGVYFGSKYLLPNISNDVFEFACSNPGAYAAVTPNWDLTLTPYQDMYINLSYAETMAPPLRVKAGISYEFKSILNDMNDSRIRIYGANYIQALAGKAKYENPNNPEEITDVNGLASFYIKANTFANGKKLRKLILGTDDSRYQNDNFTTLNIANDYPVLEEINIKNCGNLGGTLDLSKSTSVKVIEAQGTRISQVLLPEHTNITTLHLPETITKVELKSAHALTDFSINNRQGNPDTSYLTQLNINDSDYSIDWLEFAANILHQLDLVYLTQLHTTTEIDDISELEPFAIKKRSTDTYDANDNIDSMIMLTGKITVTGRWSIVEKFEYGETDTSVWPLLQLECLQSESTKFSVTYVDTEGKKLWTQFYDQNETFLDPTVELNPDTNQPYISTPTLAPTAEFTWRFGTYTREGTYNYLSGWVYANSINNEGPNRYTPVTQNVTLKAYFPQESAQTNKYTVYFYDDIFDENNINEATIHSLGRIEEIPYGSDVTSYPTPDMPTYMTVQNSNMKDRRLLNTRIDRSSNSSRTTKIFKGWDMPLGRLTGDLRVHALWETSSIDYESISSIADINTLNPADWYAISNSSQLENLLKNHIGQDIINIPMGYDVYYTNSDICTTSTLVDEPTYVGYTQSMLTKVFNNIKPLSDNLDWTLAIDYKIAYTDAELRRSTSNQEYTNTSKRVFASCYSKLNGTEIGFKLELLRDSGNNQDKIQVTWGSASVIIDGAGSFTDSNNVMKTSFRNIITLRHNKAQPNLLMVYYHNDSQDSNLYGRPYKLQTEVAVQILDCQQFRTTNVPLAFGGIVNENGQIQDDINTVAGIGGTIYWCKYWTADLGESTCQKLIRMPHMTLPCKIVGCGSGNYSIFANNNIHITFTSLLPLSERFYHNTNAYGFSSNEEYGWHTHHMYRYFNQEVYKGLSQAWQTLIVPNSISNVYVNSSGFPSTTSSSNTVFLTSNIEINGPTDNNSYNQEARIKSPIFIVNNLVGNNNLLYYSSDTRIRVMTLENAPDKYANIPKFRFSNNYLAPEAKICYISSDPSGLSSTIDIIDDKTGTTIGYGLSINNGDMWIIPSGNSIQASYLYVDEDAIARGEPYDRSAANNRGGWKQASPWLTRTYDLNGTAGASRNFLYVNSEGTVQRVNNYSGEYYLLIPEFSI